MPIPAYVGLQGHGKTYEVVESVIVRAVQQKRRIVTNIAGLNLDAIAAFILETTKEIVTPQVVVVGNKEVESDKFFPNDDITDSFCKAGDLVIIDEAWRFWATDSRILQNHFIFFREHRHFVHPETGITCDLVVICQDIGDLHPKLKRVVERTFVMRKLKEIGLDTGYSVHQYEKTKISSRGLINHWVKRYDKRIFALYKSYSAGEGGQGREMIVDRRQNIFNRRSLWIYAGVVLIIGIWGVRFLYNFFSGKDLKKSAPVVAEEKKGDRKAVAKPLEPVGDAPAVQRPGVSADQWQVQGYYVSKQSVVVVLRSDSGRYRYVYDPPNIRIRGVDVGVVLDGQGITPYTGASRKPGSLVK